MSSPILDPIIIKINRFVLHCTRTKAKIIRDQNSSIKTELDFSFGELNTDRSKDFLADAQGCLWDTPLTVYSGINVVYSYGIQV